jgi:hypothetical protein
MFSCFRPHVFPCFRVFSREDTAVKKFQYEEFRQHSRNELERAFQSGDALRIRSALYSAAQYEPDWRWTQEQSLSFLHHSNQDVRWAAALSLGFVALYHKNLDLDRVLPELLSLRDDPAIRGPVQDSLELIRENIRTQ